MWKFNMLLSENVKNYIQIEKKTNSLEYRLRSMRVTVKHKTVLKPASSSS